MFGLGTSDVTKSDLVQLPLYARLSVTTSLCSSSEAQLRSPQLHLVFAYDALLCTGHMQLSLG